MPFYEYECENCKFYSEVMQKISDAPLTKCPSCGKKKLKKLVSAPNFRLKGGGWYETDFKGDQESKRNLAAADKEEPKPEPKADTKPADKSDSKTEAKTDSKADAAKPDTESKPQKAPESKKSKSAAKAPARARSKPAARAKSRAPVRKKGRR